MRIIEGTKEFLLDKDSVVAIGKFDGFHVGHQTILKEVMKKKAQGLESVIFTFSPSPANFFSKGALKELTTVEEKRQLFEQAGVDILIEYPFDMATAQTKPEDFIKDILIEQIHAKCIVAGDDVSFGANGLGDYALLQKMSTIYDYEVKIIQKVKLHGHEISSTYVREAIKQGDMETASLLLGTPFHISGVVSKGHQLGRTMGMPTANLYPGDGKLLPPFGVYYAKILLDGKLYKGIANIGMRPTVTNEKKISVETYIYDLNQDIYGKAIQVSLLKFKRPEQKFANIDELKKQMEKDIREGATY